MTIPAPLKATAVVLFSILANLAATGCDNRENNAPSLLLKPAGHIEKKAGLEISGLVKSRLHNDVYWGVNDSGNPATIVPLSPEGKVVSRMEKGIPVNGAQNIDWEALAVDHSGKLYICDAGNNYSRRKELQLYTVPEPGLERIISEKAELIKIRYPDQTESSPEKLIHDCEAAFFFREKLYLLTKRLHDAATTLYRLDRKEQNTVNTLTLLKTYPIGGYVTGADISPDQDILAVLTYKSLWLFYDFPGDDFFSGKKKQIRLEGGGQIEAIVFVNNEELMLVNETRNEIFTVTLDYCRGNPRFANSRLP